METLSYQKCSYTELNQTFREFGVIINLISSFFESKVFNTFKSTLKTIKDTVDANLRTLNDEIDELKRATVYHTATVIYIMYTRSLHDALGRFAKVSPRYRRKHREYLQSKLISIERKMTGYMKKMCQEEYNACKTELDLIDTLKEVNDMCLISEDSEQHENGCGCICGYSSSDEYEEIIYVPN